MIGMTYCSIYVSSALWLAVSLPFVHFHSIWGKGTLSCGFWYILLLATVDVGIFLILAILTRWYKKRRRQDVLPNEHYFAERYYSTTINFHGYVSTIITKKLIILLCYRDELQCHTCSTVEIFTHTQGIFIRQAS